MWKRQQISIDWALELCLASEGQYDENILTGSPKHLVFFLALWVSPGGGYKDERGMADGHRIPRRCFLLTLRLTRAKGLQQIQ